MTALKKHLLGFPLFNFLTAALLGLFMRYAAVGKINLPFVYRYVTHAHSHVAMLGWVYLALFVLLLCHFLPTWHKKYNILFLITQVSVTGMLFSFLFQGYGAFSIAFSSLHVLSSYAFFYFIRKDTKHPTSAGHSTLNLALIFMFISTMGLWLMAPIMALKVPEPWNQIPVQFFLHFQFNGWFIFAILSLLFKILKIQKSAIFRRFIVTLSLSLLLTFALPLNGFIKSSLWWGIHTLGIAFQLLAVYYFIRIVNPHLKNYLTTSSATKRLLLYFSLGCFGLKVAFQSMVLIPELAQKSHLYPNFIIGFIHLIMLGVVSGFLFLYFLELPTFIHSKATIRTGIFLFIFGIISTEVLLFVQGVLFYLGKGIFSNYFLYLFIASISLVLGVFFVFIQLFFKKKKHVIFLHEKP